MQWLAALVPRPRLHLIRFHGVLAPNAKLRSDIIPSPAEHATEHSTDVCSLAILHLEKSRRHAGKSRGQDFPSISDHITSRDPG